MLEPLGTRVELADVETWPADGGGDPGAVRDPPPPVSRPAAALVRFLRPPALRAAGSDGSARRWLATRFLSGWRGSAAVVHVGRRRVDRSGCSRATLSGMFNALEVAHELTAGGVDRDQAEVIAGAISRAAEHGDHVTSEQFKAGLAELELRLIKWMVGTVLATAGLTVTILRFLG